MDTPQLQNWQESRGSSPELMQLYQSYNVEALLAMAAADDVYALQVVHDHLRNDGQLAQAYAGLMRAAALGSSAALIMAGEALQADSLLWQRGALHGDTLRTVYGFSFEPGRLQLQVGVTAHYVAAALMGDVDRADIHMEQMLMAYSPGFIEQHWPAIEEQAELLLQKIARDRGQELALSELNHGYPDDYARFYGLPFGQVSGQYLFERWR